jgi:hypothetical protein
MADSPGTWVDGDVIEDILILRDGVSIMSRKLNHKSQA